MILRGTDHVQMARAQHEWYEALVLKTRDNSKENIPHSTQSYTFVVDYGETMDDCLVLIISNQVVSIMTHL